VKPYEIKHMIIDEEAYGEEAITTDFKHNHKEYSLTLKKEDLEVINAWVFENGSSLPANLSEEIINSIREDIKKSNESRLPTHD
jgi:hypothetical protein